MAKGGERGRGKGADGGENRGPKISKVASNQSRGGDGKGGIGVGDGSRETRAGMVGPGWGRKGGRVNIGQYEEKRDLEFI